MTQDVGAARVVAAAPLFRVPARSISSAVTEIGWLLVATVLPLSTLKMPEPLPSLSA